MLHNSKQNINLAQLNFGTTTGEYYIGRVEKKKFSIGDIKALTDKINHINTGENGINGVFLTKLFVARINLWNDQVEPSMRMVYNVNNVILTDWKGN